MKEYKVELVIYMGKSAVDDLYYTEVIPAENDCRALHLARTLLQEKNPRIKIPHNWCWSIQAYRS